MPKKRGTTTPNPKRRRRNPAAGNFRSRSNPQFLSLGDLLDDLVDSVTDKLEDAADDLIARAMGQNPRPAPGANRQRTSPPPPPAPAPTPTPQSLTHYDILEVSPYASVPIIRAAYIALAKEHHPDRNPGNLHAENTFKRIAAAYEVLNNPEARSQYDRSIGLIKNRR